VGVVAVGANFCTSKGGMAGADAWGMVGVAATLGSSADTGGSGAEDVGVGAGTAAAPGVGVGVGSAIAGVV